jgi:biopolymer transport protein ExbD
MAKANPFGNEEEPELDISPLIDVAFLLLIYFIVTTTLTKSEADLQMVLPGIESSAPSKAVMIDQMSIEVDRDGAILINDRVADGPESGHALPALTEELTRYAASARIAGTEPQIIIKCDDDAQGQRFIDALNACAKANITQISLAR